MISLRKAWFEYVAKIRKKLARKSKTTVSHREAMKVAAETWPGEKVKLQAKWKRIERKRLKEEAKDTKNKVIES